MPRPSDLTPEQRAAEAKRLAQERRDADREDAPLFIKQVFLLEADEEDLRTALSPAEYERVLAYRRERDTFIVPQESAAPPPSFPSPWKHALPRADAVPWHLLTNPILTPDERTFRSETTTASLIKLNTELWMLFHGSTPEFSHITPMCLHVISPLTQGDVLPLLLSSPIGEALLDVHIITSDNQVIEVSPADRAVSVLTETPVDISLASVVGHCIVAITGSNSESDARVLWVAFCSVEAADS